MFRLPSQGRNISSFRSLNLANHRPRTLAAAGRLCRLPLAALDQPRAAPGQCSDPKAGRSGAGQAALPPHLPRLAVPQELQWQDRIQGTVANSCMSPPITMGAKATADFQYYKMIRYGEKKKIVLPS